MNKKNLVILVYMTLECNIRCYYCVVNFKKEYISFQTIDEIINFIKINRDNFWEISIEFFWWEPLLVFDKIKYFVENSITLNLKYKITTNGILINKEIIWFFDRYFDSVYISFSFLSLKNIKSLYRIYSYIWINSISKYAITFIYHPDNCFKDHIKFLNIIIWIWYKNINVLPLYMYKNYDFNEFKNLEIFLNYIKKINNINFEYFYFMDNKIDLEFSIMPDWFCTLDSWETIYDMKNYSKDFISLWNISDLNANIFFDKIKDFNLLLYMKEFLDSGLVKQSYSNFIQLSNILKSYK